MNDIDTRPAPRFRLRSSSDEWFESLTPGNQAVIRWFADTFGRGMSRPRAMLITDFYRLHGPKPPVPVPTADKYEFAFSRFGDFKQYCLDRMVPIEGGEEDA